MLREDGRLQERRRKFPKQDVFNGEVLGELPVTNHFFARLGTETGVECRDDCLYQLVISHSRLFQEEME
jgi:hypothetical protein